MVDGQNRPVDDIGDKLKELREALGLTQMQLAQRSGTSRGAIAKIESKVTKKPSENMTAMISRGIGVKPETMREYLSGAISAEKVVAILSKEQMSGSMAREIRDRYISRPKSLSAELEASIEEAAYSRRYPIRHVIKATQVGAWVTDALQTYRKSESAFDETEHREVVMALGKDLVQLGSFVAKHCPWLGDPQDDPAGYLLAFALMVRDEREALALDILPDATRSVRMAMIEERKKSALFNEHARVFYHTEHLLKAEERGFNIEANHITKDIMAYIARGDRRDFDVSGLSWTFQYVKEQIDTIENLFKALPDDLKGPEPDDDIPF